jgi:Leucine-rich repeat (LRR) protein
MPSQITALSLARARKRIADSARAEDTRLSLSGLDLTSQDLNILIPDLTSFDDLRELDLSNNHLTVLPRQLVATLPRLRTLDLSDNQLRMVPPRAYEALGA